MKKPKMNKPSKNVVLFIIIAFLLPLMIVATQSRDLNNAIGFVLYGIQAAAPSIAAIVVFAANKELRVHKFIIETEDEFEMLFWATATKSLVLGG